MARQPALPLFEVAGCHNFMLFRAHCGLLSLLEISSERVPCACPLHARVTGLESLDIIFSPALASVSRVKNIVSCFLLIFVFFRSAHRALNGVTFSRSLAQAFLLDYDSVLSPILTWLMMDVQLPRNRVKNVLLDCRSLLAADLDKELRPRLRYG